MAALPQNNLKNAGAAWLSVGACLAAMFVFSSIPGKDIPLLLTPQAFMYHFGMYGLLGYLFFRALRQTNAGFSAKKIIIISSLFGLLYGVGDEVHQIFVPNREFSVLDLLINGLGSFTGSVVRQWLE